jgi:hypothetical protein
MCTLATYDISTLNIAVEWLASFVPILEDPGSNLGPETDYPESAFCLFSVLFGQMLGY